MLGVKLPRYNTRNDCTDGQDRVVAVITDDEYALDRFLHKQPNDRYKSVSLILEECNREKIDYNNPVYKLGSYSKKLQLHPLCSNIAPASAKLCIASQGKELRVPPLSFEQIALFHGPARDVRQPATPHNGTVYPVEFASKPPYTSPGYTNPGIKQSIGVVRLPRVSANVSMGWVEDIQMRVPTWISPLYKPYGIGGPYGPNGPFYRIPSLTCHRPIKPNPLKQPIAYFKNVMTQRRKCALKKTLKPRMPRLPGLPKISNPLKKFKFSMPNFKKLAIKSGKKGKEKQEEGTTGEAKPEGEEDKEARVSGETEKKEDTETQGEKIKENTEEENKQKREIGM